MATDLSRMWIYVMQNDRGLIKIGRSIDPSRRRVELVSQLKCKIELAAALPNEGHREEEFHIRLNRYRVWGEWFSGSETSRRAIKRVLKLQNVRWPFAWNHKRANKWVAETKFALLPSRIRTERIRLIAFLKAVECGLHTQSERAGSWVLDGSIWWELHLIRYKIFGEAPVIGSRKDIPPYTTNLQAALSLWPAESRPSSWNISRSGSTAALNCCIAGLGALWQVDVEKIKPRLN